MLSEHPVILENQCDSHFQTHKLEKEEEIKSHSNFLNKSMKNTNKHALM